MPVTFYSCTWRAVLLLVVEGPVYPIGTCPFQALSVLIFRGLKLQLDSHLCSELVFVVKRGQLICSAPDTFGSSCCGRQDGGCGAAVDALTNSAQ